MPLLQSVSPNIKLILLDVDGVLTDGRFGLLPTGEEIKFFSIYDGMAIRLAQKAGLEVAFLSGRSSQAVTVRARELGVEIVIQGSVNKVADFEKLLAEKELGPQEVAYVGDDLPDIPVLKAVGFSAAPANAADAVKYCVQYIARNEGGSGAVREVIHVLLKATGKWDDLTAPESNVPAAG